MKLAIDWPIGSIEERAQSQTTLPSKWFDANPYLTWYELFSGTWNFHTGADLNSNDPGWNADFHSPVFSVADGIVIFAGQASGTWGQLVVIAHSFQRGPFAFCSRYGHLENVSVKVNDAVKCGQQIARVGDGSGFFGNGREHLHFDISQTELLLSDPQHWPIYTLGKDFAKTIIQKNYTDPIQFIAQYKKSGLTIPDEQATEYLEAIDAINIRTLPSITGKHIGYLLRGQKVKELDVQNGFSKIGDERWAFKKYLRPFVETAKNDKLNTKELKAGDKLRVIVTGGLRVRTMPMGRIIGMLNKNEIIELRSSDIQEQNGFVWALCLTKFASGPYWVAIKTPSESEIFVEKVTLPVITVPTDPIINQPPATRKGSKFGMHILPRARVQEIYSLLSEMHKVGKPIAGITNCHFGWDSGEVSTITVKQLSPNTKVVVRPYRQYWEFPNINWNDLNAYFVGQQFVKSYMFNIVEGKFKNDYMTADWHQIICEPSIGKYTHEFWKGAIDCAKQEGIKLAVYNFATGYPKTPAEDTFWSEQFDVIRAIRDGGHLLSLHQYLIPDPADKSQEGKGWASQWSTMRHKRILPYLENKGAGVLTGFTEYGTAYGYSLPNDEYLYALATTDEQLKNEPNVLFANYWTFGDGVSWSDSLLDVKLEITKTYLMNYNG